MQGYPKSYIGKLDFGGVFEKVSHGGLLFKLKSIGVGDSVLSICRKFFSLVCGSQYSNRFKPATRMLLGPLLFIQYTSEMFVHGEYRGVQTICLCR